MYDPTTPNVYKRVRFDMYCKERQKRDGLKGKPVPKQTSVMDAAKANPLDDGMTFTAERHAVASSCPSSAEPRREGSAALPSRLLTMTAAELHQLRVRHSAELGIQHAVELQREALETEHKVRKLEGADTKSRISKLLSRMRDATAPASAFTDPTSLTHDTAAQAEGTGVATHANTISCNDAHGGVPQDESVMRAPLVFKPSAVAAGGFVLTASTSDARSGKPTLQGKPSSTLLIRCREHSLLTPILATSAALSPTNACPTEGQLRDRMSLVQHQMAPLLEEIRSVCSSHGVVRSTRVYLLTPEEAEALVRRAGHDADSLGNSQSTPPPPHRVARERLRVFVRFDSVASAFTAAEELQRRAPSWCVAFFPTTLYDAGALAPSEGEALCGA